MTEERTRVVRPTDPLAISLIQQKQNTGSILAELILTGLEAMIQQARAGDPGARAVCRRITEAAAEMRLIAAVRLPDELES